MDLNDRITHLNNDTLHSSLEQPAVFKNERQYHLCVIKTVILN